MSDEGHLVAGRYRIVQRLGTGAMGAVWQAQDEVLHRTVAIKQLLLQPGLDEDEAEDARQRTMREGRIAARLHHPNAITVFDVVTDDHGQPCLIMEYLASTSLAAVLQERTLPPLEVARIGAQVAAALAEAHAYGIVHRDIKPGNILLAGNGAVKITDFGISRAKDDVTVTKTGMIAGTPAYLAPEVAIGGDPGPESDVFSLGSTLYAATEGQPPFGLSENTLGLLHAVAAGQINPPRQSGPLASVLAVLLHPEIEHRPTAEECEELLAAVARGETPLGGPTGAADATTIAPALGAAALGAGAGAAAGAALAEEDLPSGHSGTLGDAGPDFYADVPDEDYAPASGFPEQDYDSYRAQGPDATRAVPAGAYADYEPYDDYPGEYQDDYQDYADPYEDDRPAPPEADPDEEEERGNWKLPAAIGTIVVAGLVALGVWLFSGPKGNDEADQDPVQPPADTTSSAPVTTTTSAEPTSTEPTEEPDPTSDRSRSRQPEDNNPPPQPPPPDPPEPTDEPDPTTTTTTTKSKTTTSPPDPPDPTTTEESG
ncbi:serine/threonine-protein kinase [Amycolatopsis aidingensis]|uniref:serine/threonine-protein kinase n=1 Tax=Amycolatopsis aidingensis TaxID=2842453 RepID=UPI001C0CFE9A|nr:serine/threonine-protein kinase [Amycolatopsis aidingensis]